MATHREILASMPGRIDSKEVADPMSARSTYVSLLHKSIAEHVESLSQRQARDVAEALYAAYQIGRIDSKEVS